jgi:PDZ domain-containing protein
MRRQATTLLVSSLLAVILAFVGMHLPAPYVQDAPGPVSDTLGTAQGKPLITIAHSTSTPTGKIYLVTVSESGGPRQNISAFQVLLGWWKRSDAVIPRRLLYPSSNTTPQQVATQDANDMLNSQEAAKVAALRYLKYPLTPGVVIASVVLPELTGKLMEDDVIIGVDNTTVANTTDLQKVEASHKSGDQIVLHVMRGGTQLDVPVTLHPPANGATAPTIGISVADSFTKPFAIDINLFDVGGPSAGTAFALGIVDKLTDGNLTGGRTIAVTGTIDADGNVGAIGGVIQKMAGARSAGATVFLVPKPNCAEALTAVPHGLRLVPITTLTSAVDVLKQINAGSSDIPTCAAK